MSRLLCHRLLATNLLCDAPSYAADMCLARAERHSPPGQPLLREAVLTEQGQLAWLSSALGPQGWNSPVAVL